MDILEPELIWVEGRCYRFCDSNVWSSKKSNEPYEDADYYQTEFAEMMGINEVCEDDEIQIDTTSDGNYKHTFYVPKAFYGFIIGYKGGVMKKIETETKTSMTIPKLHSHSEQIEIVGSNRANVISCRRRIDLLVESSRNKIPFTHFVSIPLNFETIMKNYENFKKDILNDVHHETKGISEDIFVNSKKLHLTIGMLRLLNDKEKKEAIETLCNCIKDVIEPILLKIKSPIAIKIQGVNYMNDDPSKITVLYSEVLKNDILQEIADKTFEYFINNGLMSVQYTKKVKLHMTLMKSSRSKKGGRILKFDATKILQDYKDYLFGEIVLKTINISERGTEAADGHYEMITNMNISS